MSFQNEAVERFSREFFERNKLFVKSSIKPQFNQTPSIKRKHLSQDLLALHTVTKAHSRSKGNEEKTQKSVKKIDFDHVIKPKMKFINEVELPSSPVETPSSLMIMGSKHNAEEDNANHPEKTKSYGIVKQKPEEINKHLAYEELFNNPVLFKAHQKVKLQNEKRESHSTYSSSNKLKGEKKKISWNLLDEKTPDDFLSPQELEYRSNTQTSAVSIKMDDRNLSPNLFLKPRGTYQKYHLQRYRENIFVTEDFQATPLLKYEKYSSDIDKHSENLYKQDTSSQESNINTSDIEKYSKNLYKLDTPSQESNINTSDIDKYSKNLYKLDTSSQESNISNYSFNDRHNSSQKYDLEAQGQEHNHEYSPFRCPNLTNSYDQSKHLFLPRKDLLPDDDWSIWDKLYKKPNTSVSSRENEESALIESDCCSENNKSPVVSYEKTNRNVKEDKKIPAKSEPIEREMVRTSDAHVIKLRNPLQSCSPVTSNIHSFPTEKSDSAIYPHCYSVLDDHNNATSSNEKVGQEVQKNLENNTHSSVEKEIEIPAIPDNLNRGVETTAFINWFCEPPSTSSLYRDQHLKAESKSVTPEHSEKEPKIRISIDKDAVVEESTFKEDKNVSISPLGRFKLCKQEQVEDVLEEMDQLENQDNSNFSEELLLEDAMNEELEFRNSSKEYSQVVPEDFSDRFSVSSDGKDCLASSVFVPENNSSVESDCDSDYDVIVKTMDFLIQNVILNQQPSVQKSPSDSQLHTNACSEFTRSSIISASLAFSSNKDEIHSRTQCQKCSNRAKNVKSIQTQTDAPVICDKAQSPLQKHFREFGTQFSSTEISENENISKLSQCKQHTQTDKTVEVLVCKESRNVSEAEGSYSLRSRHK